MAQEFENQGGAATMDPPAIARWATSVVGRRVIAGIPRKRARAEAKRKKAGAPHRIEYFHQIEDGYSHLAAQLLEPILERYDVELVCHLVAGPSGKNLPEPELLLRLSRVDAAAVAPHYGLRFPAEAGAPEPELLELATRILAATEQQDFPARAVAVGDALWSEDRAALDALATRYGAVDASVAKKTVKEGTARREKLGHYSGGMFLYGNEWYWGADRLYHLEKRLIEYGANRVDAPELVCPRPEIEFGPLRDDGRLTFEIYPSLRSPYTGVIFDTAVELAKRTGVETVMRPVLPMVMRGVPVTPTKGMYVVTDAAREAFALGDTQWGNFYDPIGQPVRNAYSLYPWARKLGKGTELLSAFFQCAFRESVNTNNERGLRTVVERAGLPWDEAKTIVGSTEWEDEFEANRLAMYDFGSWGVPSFRLLDEQGNSVLALWGQDRLWLFSREIQRLLREREARND